MPSVHLAAARELPHASDPEETAETDDDTPRGVLFRAVFENVPEPVVLLDDNRRYVDANRAARKFVGMSKVDFHRRRLDDLTPAEYHGGLDEMWEGFLRSGVMQGVYPLVLGNGLERSVQFRAMAHIIPGRHVCTFRLADSEDQRSELRVEAPSPARNLTAREREVLTLLARGSSAEAIAEYAVLSPETVRTHIRNAMEHAGARTRAHLVAVALRDGLIED
jgi:DNA-binding CsgD family transcriptional regulator